MAYPNLEEISKSHMKPKSPPFTREKNLIGWLKEILHHATIESESTILFNLLVDEGVRYAHSP